MARLAHRDKSALSRFENGHARPRDMEQLIAAYVTLAPAELPRKPISKPGTLFIALYVGRWMVFAIAEVFAGLFAGGDFDDMTGQADMLRNQMWRAFLALSVLGLVAFTWRRRRQMGVRNSVVDLLVVLRVLGGPVLLCVALVVPHVLDDWAAELATVLMIETGYWSVAIWSDMRDY